MNKENKRIVLSIYLLSFFAILLIYLIPKFLLLKDPTYKEAFMEYVKSLGIKGILLMISINAIQVVLFILPGEPFEILSGVLYGPFLGLLYVLIGVSIANYIIYYLVSFLKLDIKKYIKKDKILTILKNEKRLELYLFSIILIPGFPKDIIAFVIPSTNIKLKKYILINAVARIPSILSSTYFGSLLIGGNYKIALIIFLSELSIALIGIIFNKKIVSFFERINKKKEGKIKQEE